MYKKERLKMEFFNKLGKKASAAYKMTADKTGRIAKDTKNKLKMGELKSQIDDLYQEIGKKVYEKHQREEDIDINKELEEQCTKIDVLSDEIDSLLKECLELKDKKQCPKCYKEIEREDKFCPNCGEKQTDEPAKEVEILEDLANAQVEDDNEIEKKIVAEELKDDIEEKQDNKEENEDFKNNLEKTVQIESDIEIDEENEDKE
jgi:RNA polymerase subunit RPABC4/transcription elongation factor Spt4